LKYYERWCDVKLTSYCNIRTIVYVQ
jgi:hypothetical protein